MSEQPNLKISEWWEQTPHQTSHTDGESMYEKVVFVVCRQGISDGSGSMKSLLPHWEARGLNTAAGSAGEAEAAEPPCCAGDADGAGHGLPGSRVFTQTRRGPVSTQNPARQSLQQLYFGVFSM